MRLRKINAPQLVVHDYDKYILQTCVRLSEQVIARISDAVAVHVITIRALTPVAHTHVMCERERGTWRAAAAAKYEVCAR